MTYILLSPALRTALAITLAAPLWLVACRQEPEPENDATPANVMASRSERGVGNAATLADGIPAVPANQSITPVDTAPPPAAAALTPDAAQGEKGARAVLLDWAHAMETGDWTKARAQWGHGGEDSGRTPEDFAQDWQKYQHVTVSIGDGDVEGGAGSLYYQVPVTITATLRDGRVAHLSGPVTVRRVNDVDGATPEELRWHISQSDLKSRP